MRTIANLMAVAGLSTLSACATGPETKSTPAPMAAASTPQLMLGEVPAQRLINGQCALVLWARQTMPPSRVLVALDKPAVARIELGGKQVELVRISQTGQPLHGQYPDQRFTGAGVSVGISFAADETREISGGSVLSSVMIEYVDPKGWTSLIPASGLIGCQA